MTANDNANLELFFGSLDNIPASEKAAFIASINRNCFKGAMNFLVTLILKHNPRARIVFIGNYENWTEYAPVATAQEELSESWGAQLIDVWKRYGFSGHYIPGTKEYWATSGTGYSGYDLTQFQVWNRDFTHPHTDTKGTTLAMIAGILAEELKRVR
jgi:hypothetical protein